MENHAILLKKKKKGADLYFLKDISMNFRHRAPSTGHKILMLLLNLKLIKMEKAFWGLLALCCRALVYFLTQWLICTQMHKYRHKNKPFSCPCRPCVGTAVKLTELFQIPLWHPLFQVFFSRWQILFFLVLIIKISCSDLNLFPPQVSHSRK